MDRRGYQQYKQQSVGSMTPGELLLLLYDELVKRATMASIALDKGQFDAFEAAVDRCTDIVNYLDETLDRQYPISQDLSRMYEYFTAGTRRSWNSSGPSSPTCGMRSISLRRTAAPSRGRTVRHDPG